MVSCGYLETADLVGGVEGPYEVAADCVPQVSAVRDPLLSGVCVVVCVCVCVCVHVCGGECVCVHARVSLMVYMCMYMSI